VTLGDPIAQIRALVVTLPGDEPRPLFMFLGRRFATDFAGAAYAMQLEAQSSSTTELKPPGAGAALDDPPGTPRVSLSSRPGISPAAPGVSPHPPSQLTSLYVAT
jgi:hypothetical protein